MISIISKAHYQVLSTTLAACLAIPSAVVDAAETISPARPPNVVFILADDLGYGDLGCYGSQQNRTPHIDRLATEGIRFTDFHSNGPMCTPTRAALLTGLYQQRLRLEEPLFPGTRGLPPESVTLPKLLKDAGYTTAIYGKWHLGFEAPAIPTRMGFDEFRGLLGGCNDHHTHINRGGELDWWNGERIDMEKGYTTDLITRYSIDFIERHRDRPFFLYVSHLAIHLPWQGPDDPPHRQQGGNYGKDKFGIIPERGNVAPHVKAMIESLDRSVGAIVGTIQRLNLDRNTVVFFTSDNGGYINYRGGFANISSNGPLRGQKSQLYEGGHRVPAVAWWPGRIQPGICAQTVLTFDLMPTVLRLASAPPYPGDGVDLGDLLFREAPLPGRQLFWRKGGTAKAVREGPWKLIMHNNKSTPELYNLADDLGETLDLAAQQPERVRELSAALTAWEQEVDMNKTDTSQ